MASEREHAERVAHELLNGRVSSMNWCTCGVATCDKYGVFSQVADLIARERANARTKALEEADAIAVAVEKACQAEAGSQDDKEEHDAWENWGNGAQDVAERIRALKESK